MKPSLLVFALAILPAIGCDARTAYVDVDRAANECSDGQKLIAEMKAFDQERQRTKSSPSTVPIPSDDEWIAQRQAKINAGAAPIVARLRRILPAIAKARRVSGISSMAGMAYVRAELDATAELVKRYDAGEGAEDKTAELAAAKAKVQALERQLGAADLSRPGGARK